MNVIVICEFVHNVGGSGRGLIRSYSGVLVGDRENRETALLG
jgi:hypothetical protein